MLKIELVLESYAMTGEGAIWSPEDNSLYWVDIPNKKLNRFEPDSGKNHVYDMPTEIGCFSLVVRGGHVPGAVVALNDGFYYFDFNSQKLVHINNPKGHEKNTRFNDGTTDSSGRFWAGTMPMGGQRETAVGSLYVLDLDGTTRAVESGLWVQNGLAFSPDGKTMYLSDSHPNACVVWAYDYDPDDGVPSNKRVFYDASGRVSNPDGAAVDCDGCYWIAGVHGWELLRLTPEGKIDQVIRMPIEKPTKIAFGGPNLDIMYVTSIGNVGVEGAGDPDQPYAGCLFAVETGQQGLPSVPYAGDVPAL